MKPIKFDLPLNGKRIATLEQLGENLTPEILEPFRSGKLAKWLRVRKLDEQAEAVEALLVGDNEREVQLLKNLYAVFDSEINEDLLRTAIMERKKELPSSQEKIDTEINFRNGSSGYENIDKNYAPVPSAPTRVLVPAVNDDTHTATHDTPYGVTSDTSVNSFQLLRLKDAFSGRQPTLTKWWFEEHLPYGKVSDIPESDSRVTEIFDEFATIKDFDKFCLLIKELDNKDGLNKSLSVFWLSNRVSTELLEFVSQNFEIHNLNSIEIVKFPEHVINALKDLNITEVLKVRTLEIVRRLFTDWQLVVVKSGDVVADEIANELVTTHDNVVVLRYTKYLLVLPLLLKYRRYEKSVFVQSVNACIKDQSTESVDAVIQHTFNLLSNRPEDNELLLIDQSYAMYSTFRMLNEPDCNMKYDIQRVIF
jgi:hypothetical protein